MLGIAGLDAKCELQQLSVGSFLLLRGLWLCIPVALSGGSVILEHPAPPLQSDRPSVWQTIMSTLLLRDGWRLCRHTFRQWLYGTHGIKPTSLNSSPCLTCPNLKERSLAVTRTANTAQLGRKNTPASSVPVLHLLFGNGFSNASFWSDSSGC